MLIDVVSPVWGIFMVKLKFLGAKNLLYLPSAPLGVFCMLCLVHISPGGYELKTQKGTKTSGGKYFF